jgi:hypothetical protein
MLAAIHFAGELRAEMLEYLRSIDGQVTLQTFGDASRHCWEWAGGLSLVLVPVFYLRLIVNPA